MLKARLPKRLPKRLPQKVTRKLYTAEVLKHQTKKWQHIRIRRRDNPRQEIQGEIREGMHQGIKKKIGTIRIIYPVIKGEGFGSILLNHMMAEFGRRRVEVVSCLYFADSAGFFKKHGFRELKGESGMVKMEITMKEWKQKHGKWKKK